jgi:peptide-methionine (R)-S-oxide reductase
VESGLARDEREEIWRSRLTPEQFQIARQGGTERAFTGAYWNHKGSGTYHCICCDTPLYSSATKFDSGGDQHPRGPQPRHGAHRDPLRQL